MAETCFSVIATTTLTLSSYNALFSLQDMLSVSSGKEDVTKRQIHTFVTLDRT